MHETTERETAERRPAAMHVLGAVLVTLGLAPLLVAGFSGLPWSQGIWVIAGTIALLAGGVILGRQSRR